MSPKAIWDSHVWIRLPTQTSNVTIGVRPRVVILGGGFAGVGAAKKLKHADADVVLIDRHDYHTFQPLLYQLATGLLETSGVGHSLRDLVHDQDNVDGPQGAVTGIDLRAREVQFSEMAPLTYDYLVLGLGAEVNFFGTDGAAEHAFPMYTLADAVRLKEHVLERWEAADKDPALDRGRRTRTSSSSAAARRASRAPAPWPSSTVATSRATTRTCRRRGRGSILVEAGPEVFSMFKPNLRAYATKALEEARGRGDDRRDRRVGLPDARHAQVRGPSSKAHTLVWGAGLQGNRLVQSLGLDLQRGNRIGVGSDLTVPGRPEVFVVGDIAAITDAKTEQVLPQLGSVALQSGEHAGETIARLVAGKKAKPFKYRDKGTMATIGRGAAVVQMLGGRTMKGMKAQVAWGTVHLALLPTNEDRAKAIVDWAGAGLTHQRSGRITVSADRD